MATPISSVAKLNGAISIWGNFKVTENKFLKEEKWLLPKVEDIMYKLGGCLQFSMINLNLNQTYLQLPVDEKSHELLTINTLKELFHILKSTNSPTNSPAVWFG